MKLDRNQLAKDILLQYIDNGKVEEVCVALANAVASSGDTFENYLARQAVKHADALIKELGK